MRFRSALVLSVFVSFFVLPAWAAQYSVGPDTFCDFNSLTAAISAANSGDILYISNDSGWLAPTGGFQISKTLDLIGVNGCAQQTPENTTLSGDGSSSVLEISGNGITVTLWKITVTGGGQDADHGGGIEIRGNVDFNLMDSHVDNNDSDLGGGIYFEGTTGASMSISDFSGIQTNGATDGGGIYCTGPVSINMTSGSISVNTAVDGGGVWIGGGCQFNLSAGGLFLGVTFNDSSGDGGGIFAREGSTVVLLPGSSLTANEAGGRGGGAFVSGLGSTLSAINAQIASNSAGGDGGGVYVESEAALGFGRPSIGATLEDGCLLDPPRCAILTNNAAGSGGGVGSGGAVFAASGSSVTIQLAFVESNSATGEAGAFHVDGVGTDLTLWKSFVTKSSGGEAVIRASNGAFLWAKHTTFTGNQGQGAVFNAASGSLALGNNIIWESSGTVVATSGAGSNPYGNCLLVHESTSLASFGVDVGVADPLFIDAAADDYHLRPDSPAIDRCPEVSYAWLNLMDVDGDTIQDDPATGDASGIADAGADERAGALFVDGFESGGTSGWSSVTP